MVVGANSEPPFVSVIIPHYRDLGGLDRCLAALEAQTYPKDRFEIVVADNASPEGAEAVLDVIRGRAQLVVVHDRGAGPARNGGVAASTAATLAFTDSDCVPEPQWLAEGVAALERSDVVGGHVTVLVSDPGRMSAEEAFESVFAFDFKTYIEKKRFTGAGNMFCSRMTFETVGGFRVGMSEDLEWCTRARAAGFGLIYAPKATVKHPARRNWAELVSKWKRLNTETLALFLPRRGGRALWVLRSLLLPLSAVAHTPKVVVSPDLNSWPQRLGALQVLYRLRFWRMADALRLAVITKKS